MSNTLIDTAAVATHLDDDNWVVVDCRFDLAEPASGERAYQEGHIPGAVYGHLDRDLSGTKTGSNGRHPLPDPDRLRETLSGWGIANGVHVVAYDQQNGMYASRLWWLLRASGHDAVAVLDGGFARSIKEGRPVRAGSEQRRRRTFEGRLGHAAWVQIADVVRGFDAPTKTLLVDARAPERFSGSVEPLDPVAGHIPGAINHFFQENLTDAGRFRSPEELRARFDKTIGSTPPEDVVVYCGSGVTACHNLLAMEHAGLHGARLYAGSWSEWCSDPTRPVETAGRTSGSAR